jgi:hypothetical protein
MAEAATLERTQGRQPNADQSATIRASVQRRLGERGYLLAKKGLDESWGAADFLVDEQLVYLSMRTAVFTGNDVVVMSKDEDIQEQMFKLYWLLTVQYRAMNLADWFAFAPQSLPIERRSRTARWDHGFFDERDAVWIRLSKRSWREIAPVRKPVAVYCWILGEYGTETTFGLDGGMTRLIVTKAHTLGLNTHRLGQRNCHATLAPLEYTDQGWYGVVVRDRRLSREPCVAQFPCLDLAQAVLCNENLAGIPLTN